MAYYEFPEAHWRRVRTNNPLERILREIGRRSRLIGTLPHEQSALIWPRRGCAGGEWLSKWYLTWSC